jgi:hypothetical protein
MAKKFQKIPRKKYPAPLRSLPTGLRGQFIELKDEKINLPFVVTFPEYKHVLLIGDLEISEHHAPPFRARGIFEETSPTKNPVLKAAYEYP